VEPLNLTAESDPMKAHDPDLPEDEQFLIVLGQCVSRRRLAQGLTQDELATRSGLSRAEIQFIENAGRKPKVATVRRCCTGLGISFMELIAEAERCLDEEQAKANACIVALKVAAVV